MGTRAADYRNAGLWQSATPLCETTVLAGFHRLPSGRIWPARPVLSGMGHIIIGMFGNIRFQQWRTISMS